jgi:hypothetical protein
VLKLLLFVLTSALLGVFSGAGIAKFNEDRDSGGEGPRTTKATGVGHRFTAQISVLESLRKGDALPLFKAAYLDEQAELTPAIIRFIIASWRQTAPDSILNWLELFPLKESPTVDLEIGTCYAGSPKILLGGILEGHLNKTNPKLYPILHTIRRTDPAWLNSNIKRLLELFPDQVLLLDVLDQSASAGEILQGVPELLSRDRYTKDDGKITQLLCEILKSDEELLTLHPEGLKTLIEASSKTHGYGHDGKNLYKGLINHARMLFAKSSPDSEGKMMIPPVKLAAFLAAHVEEPGIDSGWFKDTLDFTQSSTDSSTAFLRQSGSLKGLLRDQINSFTPLADWIVRGISSSDSKSSEKSVFHIDAALQDSFIPVAQQDAFKEMILKRLDVALTSESLQALPESWRAVAATTSLTQACNDGIEKFIILAGDFKSVIASSAILETAVRGSLDPFGSGAEKFAAIIPSNSISSGTLKKFVGEGSAKFALMNPGLLKEGPAGLPQLFEAWGARNPYDCSLYLNSLGSSPEKMSAVRGLVAALEKYDPIAADVWRLQLEKPTR